MATERGERASAGGIPETAPVRAGSRDCPFTVSQLVRGTNRLLDDRVGTRWVFGEVESLSRPQSGHIYFSLKDTETVLRAVMWRRTAVQLGFQMENGLSLLCRGRLAVFERDGKFQMYIDAAEVAGKGKDALALEQLKAKLAGEGLFDAARKRRLPLLPRRIGVVTSKSGAAVRDIIRAVERRFPVPILIADARVQGQSAPESIARAIAAICKSDVDVVIVGRGGGSAGDLAAFNDERVVRAVAGCPVPTISAVGHEVDLSLTDLVADQRAATPTMAGEMAVPVLAELAKRLSLEEVRLRRELDHRLRVARQELDHLEDRARHRVEGGIAADRRRLAETRHALEALHPRAQLAALRHQLGQLGAALDAASPAMRIAKERAQLTELAGRGRATMRQTLDDGARGIGVLAGRLQALSPLGVLERGYSIALHPTDATAGGAAQVITRADQVAVGDAITVRLHHGALDCEVKGVTVESGRDTSAAKKVPRRARKKRVP